MPGIQKFDSDGVAIAFMDTADEPGAFQVAEEVTGTPVLLIHGFASNHRVNWISTGWVRALSEAGYRVIAFDNRGHGDSEKLYDQAAYGAPTMAEDAQRLLDHLDIASADVIGYSMGARISAFVALQSPDRVRRVVFGGLGENMIRGIDGSEMIAEALLSPSVDAIPEGHGRAFRAFADQTGSDKRALAACILASRRRITPAELGNIRAPALVAVGEHDEVGGDPHALAAHMPNADAFTIAGRDHMKAVGDRTHIARVLEFLGS